MNYRNFSITDRGYGFVVRSKEDWKFSIEVCSDSEALEMIDCFEEDNPKVVERKTKKRFVVFARNSLRRDGTGRYLVNGRRIRAYAAESEAQLLTEQEARKMSRILNAKQDNYYWDFKKVV